MITDLIAKLETSIRWLVGSDVPVDASGAVLPATWEAIAARLRSEGWQAEAREDGVRVADAIWLSFEQPDKIRVAVIVRRRGSGAVNA